MKILSIFVCLYSLTVFSFFEKDHVNDIKVDVIYRYGQTYFGHISYKITKDKKTSYYSYPSGNDERFDREYYGNHVEICTIYINKEKYQNFLKWYKKSIYSKFDKGNSIYTYCGHYHIINFNCAHFVEYSLRTMGIPLERFFTWKPRTPAYVFKKLKNYLKDIECCNFYHKRKYPCK